MSYFFPIFLIKTMFADFQRANKNIYYSKFSPKKTFLSILTLKIVNLSSIRKFMLVNFIYSSRQIIHSDLKPKVERQI